MIALLSEKDRDEVLALLDRDHEGNVIMIHDIMRFGLEDRGHPFQGRYFGARSAKGLGGVGALYNYGSLFVYAPDDELAPALLDHMAALQPCPRYIIARSDWARALLEGLSRRGFSPERVEEMDYLSLEPSALRPRGLEAARYAEPRDVEALVRLGRAFQMEYFGDAEDTDETWGRLYGESVAESGIAVAEWEGRAVAKAEVVASTARAALIGGVYTEPACRGRGFASACVSLLCTGITSRGAKACLNVAVDNAPARRLYLSLGFTKLCDLVLAHFIQGSPKGAV